MSAHGCPVCRQAVPAALTSGPPTAAFRCDHCGAQLIWASGRVDLKKGDTGAPRSAPPPRSSPRLPTVRLGAGGTGTPATGTPGAGSSGAGSAGAGGAGTGTGGTRPNPARGSSPSLPARKPPTQPAPRADKSQKSNVVSRVADVSLAAPGPVVDPGDWFAPGREAGEEAAPLPPAPQPPPGGNLEAAAAPAAAPPSSPSFAPPTESQPSENARAFDDRTVRDLAAQNDPAMAPAGSVDVLTPSASVRRNRWLVVIGAGTAVIAAVALVLRTGGTSSRQKSAPLPVAGSPPAVSPLEPKVAPAPAVSPAATAVAEPIAPRAAAEVPAPAAHPERVPAPHDTPAPASRPARTSVRSTASERVRTSHLHRRHTLGGRKIVLEYDSTPKSRKLASRRKLQQPPPPAPAPDAPAPAEASSDPALVARARDAYLRGNQALFSGDTPGAIAAYRESLDLYPGYVAGYRGLGLAYMEAGKKAEALDALRTYVRTVPDAHDLPLIKKRIGRLEKKR